MTYYYGNGTIIKRSRGSDSGSDDSCEYNDEIDEWMPKYYNRDYELSLGLYSQENADSLNQSILYVDDKQTIFMVNAREYNNFVIKNGIIYSTTGNGLEMKIKNYSSKLHQLCDISNLTNLEIQHRLCKLQHYLISFVDYINNFDDGYMFSTTKKSY